MIFILVTQRPLKAIFRNTGNVGEATRQASPTSTPAWSPGRAT